MADNNNNKKFEGQDPKKKKKMDNEINLSPKTNRRMSPRNQILMENAVTSREMYLKHS